MKLLIHRKTVKVKTKKRKFSQQNRKRKKNFEKKVQKENINISSFLKKVDDGEHTRHTRF